MVRRTFQAVSLVFYLLSDMPVAWAENAANWTQWRGPHRNGIVVESPQWPKSLGEEQLLEQWKLELGPSYSGPLVADGKVFVTETKDRKLEVVRAFDRKTGERIWETEWEGSMSVPFFAKANGDWIRSTPAYDSGRLYVAGMRDVLVCLDANTGDQIWIKDFVKELKTPLPSFGFVCSPLIHDGFVYVQAAGGVVKLDKLTGETAWRGFNDGGGMFGSAFSSPTIATIAGATQLVVQSRKTLAGLDLKEGKILWQRDIPAFRGMNILTPTIIDDSVFTSSYGGKTLLTRVTLDKNKFATAENWTNKIQGYMSSPIVIDGHIYLHLKNQRFTCIDIATGESKWTTKPYGKYWSLVAQGSRILALDERGELLLIEANPAEFKLLDSRKVSDESTWAHLAVAGSEVFVRSLNSLTAYKWSE